ncbi:hypothetical protein [Mangrovivirga cuniculi]|uniref:Uncharacterized protein n=1 Tax=Mangrovivirga cuniculi TaxID=2715131 RepID=A0A4D7JJV7_9BACT|nr:hypothetical protein [Mangrovivirga cuniculi]QCK16239.1 hypothetical protein DCC35_16570 [Mangrovivirga cuniculi]
MVLKQNPFSFYDFLGYLIPGIFFLSSIYFTLDHFNYIDAKNWLESVLLDNPIDYFILIIVAYVIGHIINYLSSITIEIYSNWKYGFPSKTLIARKPKGYFDFDCKKPRNWIKRLILLPMFLLPLWPTDFIFGNLFGIKAHLTRPMDRPYIDIAKLKTYSLIKINGYLEADKMGSADSLNFFRYLYHYVLENCPNHVPKLQNYVALYGLLRTFSLIFNFLFFIWFILSITKEYSLINYIIAGSCMAICYICFMAFMKFYRRFSLEVIMAHIVTYKIPESNNNGFLKKILNLF